MSRTRNGHKQKCFSPLYNRYEMPSLPLIQFHITVSATAATAAVAAAVALATTKLSGSDNSSRSSSRSITLWNKHYVKGISHNLSNATPFRTIHNCDWAMHAPKHNGCMWRCRNAKSIYISLKVFECVRWFWGWIPPPKPLHCINTRFMNFVFPLIFLRVCVHVCVCWC